MGLTNKLISKSRTKAVSGPVGITGEWNQRAELASTAIVRAVAANLGVKELQSSSFRGKEMFSFNRQINSSDSTIWVRQVNNRTWEITLGRAIWNYDRTIDWQISAAVADMPTGRVVAVVTGGYATLDGAMVNGAEFTETRDFLLAGFAQGYAKSNANELAIDSASVPATVESIVTAKPEFARGAQTVRSVLTVAQFEDCLRFLPNHTLERGAGWRVIELGFGAHTAAARLEMADHGDHRTIGVSWDITASDDGLFYDRWIFEAVGLPYQVLTLLRTVDPNATVIAT